MKDLSLQHLKRLKRIPHSKYNSKKRFRQRLKGNEENDLKGHWLKKR
jgi:hypothetical protein